MPAATPGGMSDMLRQLPAAAGPNCSLQLSGASRGGLGLHSPNAVKEPMGKKGRSAHDQLHWQQQLAQVVTSAAEQVCSSTSLQGSFLPRLPGQYSHQQSLQHTFRTQPAGSGRVLFCQIQPRALQARRLRSQALPDIADAQQPDEPSGNERILVSEVQH